MSSVNYSEITKIAYSYLDYHKMTPTKELDLLIKECIDEVIEYSQFKYIYQEFDYNLDFINNNEAYKAFLKDTTSYYLVLMTLGSRIDDRIKYYSKFNLTKMYVLDSCSSAYLEYMSDKYEEEFPAPRTYRFSPGYQGTTTADLREIFKYLRADSIGVRLLDSNLMVPQKTMCGIIGFGVERKKRCGDCTIKSKCLYLKEGRTCY